MYYFAFGNQGKIEEGLIPINELNIGKRLLHFDPVKMLPPTKLGGYRLVYVRDLSDDKDVAEKFWHDIQTLYTDWGNFGKYGDALLIEKTDKGDYFHFKVVMIGWLEFPKPVLAVDVLPFVTMGNGQMYFAGGIKKDKKTGEDIKVLCGGKRDVTGFYFESSFETAMREVKEEMGIKIIAVKTHNRISFRDLSLVGFDTNVWSSYSGKVWSINGRLEKLGDFWTSDEENHPATNSKRVHLTTAFRLFLGDHVYGANWTLTELEKFFQAGDDLCEIFFWDVKNGTPDFALAHHAEIYNAAVKTLI